MKNKYIIDYLDILVHLLNGDLGLRGEEFWSPVGTFEEVKCVADFIRMFKGIDFQVENASREVGYDFKNLWTNSAASDRYRVKFIIHKEFFSLNDSNKINAKFKEFKNWLKIKEIDNDFN